MTRNPRVLDLDALVADLNAGRLSRRAFFNRAAQFGFAAPLVAALVASTQRGAGAAPSVALQDNGKTLVVAIPQATVQLDPAIAGANGYGDAIPIADNLTEGLTRLKPGTVEIEPALAESWDVSADGLTYVFHIRPNVTFHDGTPLDAKAVETSFVRQLDEKDPYHFEGITYAEIVFADVAKVQATADLDLTVTLSKPTILLPGNLATFAAGIVSPAALKKLGQDFGQQPVGTGPFKFESWTKDVELVFTANDAYWGGRPPVDRVVWRTIADDTVRLSELRTGSIDVANQIDFKDADTVAKDAALRLISGDFLNVQFLAFNQKLAPFDNPAVRKAIQYAVNKQNIADALFSGHYTLGAGPIAPGLLGYDASLAQTYPHDPERTKSMLKDAGVSGVEFDLLNRSNSFWPLLGQLIQADLDEVGIKANLKSLEDAEFFAELNASKAQAFINDWTWDNGDPDNVMYSLFTAPRAMTRLGYQNKQVNDLNLQGQQEKDPAKRTDVYLRAQRLILDDAIMVVLGYPGRAIGAQARVKNLRVSPIGSVVLRDVDLA
jgi:peptide/nickel transport system substrate-binding protein